MPAAFESASKTFGVFGGSISITKPSGLAVGDLMIAVVASFNGGRTFTPPSGWTEVYETTHQDLAGVTTQCEKVATASDVAASSFTWSVSGGDTFLTGAILRISGADPLSPVADHAEDNTVNANTPDPLPFTCPSADASVANSLVIRYAVSQRNGSTYSSDSDLWSTPSGHTERVTTGTSAGAPNGGIFLGIDTKDDLVGVGSVGTVVKNALSVASFVRGLSGTIIVSSAGGHGGNAGGIAGQGRERIQRGVLLRDYWGELRR